MRELLSAQMLRGVEIKEAFLEYSRVSDTTPCLQPASAVPSSSVPITQSLHQYL